MNSVFHTVRDVSTCSVCSQHCQRYETLPCDHTFCESCLGHQMTRLSSLKEHETATIVCPYCRDFLFSKIAFLQVKNKKSQNQRSVNFTMSRRDQSFTDEMAKRCEPCAEMHEYSTSSFWCYNCSEYLCSTCAHYHEQMKMSNDHIVKTLRDKERYSDVRSKIYEPQKTARSVRTPRASHMSSQHTPHREKNKHRCEPCGETRHIVEAKYSCQNCNEKMCDKCAECHRSMKMSKSHKLVKVSEMRLKIGAANTDMTCDRHFGEALSLYCKRCKTSCCSVCVITAHSNCGSTKALQRSKTCYEQKPKYDTRSKTSYEQKSKYDTWSKPSYEQKARYDKCSKTDYEQKPNYYDTWSKTSYEQKPKDYSKTKAGFHDSPFLQRSKTEYPSKYSKAGQTKTTILINSMENRKSRIVCTDDVPGNWVISIALLTSGDMLLTELLQPTLKMVNFSGTVLSTLKLIGDPWSVAVYNDSLAVVTYSDRKQIQLVKIMTYGGLEAGKLLTTTHRCMAVCFVKDLIVASCWEGCIHVINIKGTELCSIDKDIYGDRLFSAPEYIAANRMGTTIYVTDYKRSTVTALKLLPSRIDNEPEFVFSHKDLRGPKGIAVDRHGAIYVSGMTSRNIFRLSPTGDLIQVYRRSADTDYYEALAVSSSADKLYVSAYEDNTIIILKMTK